MVAENHSPVKNLTILWAFNECALGGLMHAFKIPFTGIFVGGFAVILIGLIAEFSQRNFKEILQATLLVAAVKFIVSPQSPIGAYIAVFFQGIFGAICFKLILDFRIAAFIFAIIAMLESALQKLLILTILFGKAFWDALDSFLNEVAKIFGSAAENGSYTVVIIYLLVYILWGLILGFYLSALPKKLSDLSNKKLLLELSDYVNNYVKPICLQNKPRRGNTINIGLFILFVMLGILLFNNTSTLYVMLRTITGVTILFFIISPMLKYLIEINLKKRQLYSQNDIQNILNKLPRMYALAEGCWEYSKVNFKGINRIKQFSYCMLLLSLYGSRNE